jgi:hypothetical protein
MLRCDGIIMRVSSDLNLVRVACLLRLACLLVNYVIGYYYILSIKSI